MPQNQHPATYWYFLYSRNKDRDYSFVILPEIISTIKGGASALEGLLGNENGFATTNIGGIGWYVYFKNIKSELNGKPVLDHVGRNIDVVHGILSEVKLDSVDYLIDKNRKENGGITSVYWGKLPAISSPQSIDKEPILPVVPPSFLPEPPNTPIKEGAHSFTIPKRVVILIISLFATSVLLNALLIEGSILASLHSKFLPSIFVLSEKNPAKQSLKVQQSSATSAVQQPQKSRQITVSSVVPRP